MSDDGQPSSQNTEKPFICNFLILHDWRPRYKFYIYIDDLSETAKIFFARNQVKVKEKRRYIKDKENYMVVFCKVRKRDIHDFMRSLEEYREHMKIRQCTDYERFCSEFFDIIEANFAN